MYTRDDLQTMQGWPLERKILVTQTRIMEWYMRFNGQVYVAFSGGKDSTVLLDLARRIYPDIPAMFADTGLEYPEIREFVKSKENITIVRPEMNFKQVIAKYGYPVASKELSIKIQYAKRGAEWAKKYVDGSAVDTEGRPSRYAVSKRWLKLMDAPFEVSAYCCEVMKKRPANKYAKETGRKPIVGTMAAESMIREQAWMRTGCNAYDGKVQKSSPMSFWTEQDVLQYIKKFNVPYCSVYGDIVPTGEKGYNPMTGEEFDFLKTTGCDRTGCMFCMFGCHLEKKPNRFQRLRQTHPRQYEYCIGGGEMVDGKWLPNKDGLGLGKVLDYIGVKYD